MQNGRNPKCIHGRNETGFYSKLSCKSLVESWLLQNSEIEILSWYFNTHNIIHFCQLLSLQKWKEKTLSYH